MDDVKPETEAPAELSEKAVDTATDPIEEATPEPVKKVADNPGDEIPPWGHDLMTRMDALTEMVTKPVEEVTDMPSHGHEVESDESPAKPPWTHRKLFG